MAYINKDARASKILQIMDEVENSPLTINQYFKEKKPPFGRAQYYLYKKALREKGEAGLHDQRSKGNNLKFTNDVKNFAKGVIEYNRSMTSTEVQNAIKNKFGVIVSDTVIKNFRRENDLNWIRPKMVLKPFDESGASEIPIALALFSLPLVTANGRVRSVDNPRGNALKYLCGLNYKASTLDKHLNELKYLQLSNELIEATAKFWIDFGGARNKLDSIFACYYIDGNTKALWSSKSCHKGKVTMLGRVMNCLEQVFIHDGQGHPIYFQTFNGHADLGKNALRMMDTLSEYLLVYAG